MYVDMPKSTVSIWIVSSWNWSWKALVDIGADFSLMLCYLLVGLCYSMEYASCRLDENKKAVVYKQRNLPDSAAWVKYGDTVRDNGWFQIHIETNENFTSEDQLYCAGYLEGYVSYHRMKDAYKALLQETGLQPDDWMSWMNINRKYAIENSSKKDEYWRNIALILKQLDGLLDGYNEIASIHGDSMSEDEMWFYQASIDLNDLMELWESPHALDPEDKLKCSGLIKLAPNYQDIYFAQDTWNDYRELNAVLKEYHFKVKEFKANKVIVSTRPGHLPSIDDFWITDRGLLILETTMNNYNTSLIKQIVPESLFTWIRSYYASWTTDNGRDWTTEFIKENSGTYNNQYLVLDAKHFSLGKKPEKDLLWAIEQFPTTYHAEDITSVLVNQSFFGSVNAPFFKDMFDIADYPGAQERDPTRADFLSYFNQPRYRVMERDAPHINSYEGFKKFMRSNNWRSDPLIKGEPGQGILSRYDLRPENGTRLGKKKAFGGLDAKTCRMSEAYNSMLIDAINSPQYEDNPPFKFSDWPSIYSGDLPNEWKFKWIEFKADNHNRCSAFDRDKCLSQFYCGWCGEDSVCMPASGSKSPGRGFSCASGWHFPGYGQETPDAVIITITVLVFIFVGAVFTTSYVTSRKNTYTIK